MGINHAAGRGETTTTILHRRDGAKAIDTRRKRRRYRRAKIRFGTTRATTMLAREIASTATVIATVIVTPSRGEDDLQETIETADIAATDAMTIAAGTKSDEIVIEIAIETETEIGGIGRATARGVLITAAVAGTEIEIVGTREEVAEPKTSWRRARRIGSRSSQLPSRSWEPWRRPIWKEAARDDERLALRAFHLFGCHAC